MPRGLGPSRLSYILPLRRESPDDVAELAAYVKDLAPLVELLVVDGSPGPVFDAHAAAFAGAPLVHLAPDPRWQFRNGKVDGVMTGLHRCSHDAVVIADDDVRWDATGLRRMAELLEGADVVRPQNYFDPLPWHARWDTARTLLNRAFGSDCAGTIGVRRSVVLGAGGYDGDAMFENLELVRTVVAVGATVTRALDLNVRRLPPSTRQFLRQRVRQAYDDFAQPVRLLASLAVLPLAAVAAHRRRLGSTAALLAAASVAAAERGRRRGGGAAVYPPTCSLLAPLWVTERAVCSWLAVGSRLCWGGIRYRGRVLPLAAHSRRQIRRHIRGRASFSGPTTGPAIGAAHPSSPRRAARAAPTT